MSPRNYLKENMEAAIVVALSSGLAIVGATHFEHSGPDQALLRQLREVHQVRELPNAGGEIIGEQSAGQVRPMPLYAQR